MLAGAVPLNDDLLLLNFISKASYHFNGSRISTEYTYDEDDNIVTMIDGEGNTVRYEYDSRGNRTLEQDAVGNTLTRSYSTENQLLSETRYLGVDPNMANTTNEASHPLSSYFVYDSEQHLRFSISASGQVTEYRYNTEGLLVSTWVYTQGTYTATAMTEHALSQWSSTQDLTQIQRTDNSYDFRGQLQSMTTYAATTSSGEGINDGSESTTVFVYDQNGRLLERVEPKGVATADVGDYRTTYTYDGLGRVLSVRDALGNITTTDYHDSQQSIQTTAANGLISTRLFDNSGRLVSQSQTEGAAPLGTTQYTYDTNINRLITTDPLGNQTHIFYDGLGREIATIDAERALTRRVYDSNGNLVQTIAYEEPVTDTHLLGFTAGGEGAAFTELQLNVIQSAIADSQNDRVHFNLYNAADQLVYTVDALGGLTHYFYDGAGQLTDTIEYADTISTLNLNANSTADDITVPTMNANLITFQNDNIETSKETSLLKVPIFDVDVTVEPNNDGKLMAQTHCVCSRRSKLVECRGVWKKDISDPVLTSLL